MVLFKVNDRLIAKNLAALYGKSAGRAPSLHVITWHCLTTEGKSTDKASVMVVEKCYLGTIRCVDMAAFWG